MIARSLPHKQQPSWQIELQQAISDPAELCQLLELDPALAPTAKLAAAQFRLRVPRNFVARMQKGNPRDPLLLQVLPVSDELLATDGYSSDPVGDLAAMESPGLLHKYQGRVLLIASSACAVNCRYCFRRHFPYSDGHTAGRLLQTALERIAADASITEVILSGGDPLMLNDERLAMMARALDDIPHLRRLRIHTRLPVVLPNRVDDQLLDWLGRGRLKRVMVLHINHPTELSPDLKTAIRKISETGAVLLNQSVLLAGVNDTTDTLIALSEALFDAGVQPYYLHLLDKVQGAAHFDLPESRAVELMEELRSALPGYLVPQLVREQAGEPYKTPVD